MIIEKNELIKLNQRTNISCDLALNEEVSCHNQTCKIKTNNHPSISYFKILG